MIGTEERPLRGGTRHAHSQSTGMYKLFARVRADRSRLVEYLTNSWSSVLMIRRLRSLSIAAVAACATAGLLACGSDSGMSPSATGSVSVALTDAPFPFDAVTRADLFVVRIDAKLADTDSADADAGKDDDSHANTDPSRGWVTIASPNQAFNLLDLQHGKTANLAQVTLPTGLYHGFRLILDVDKSSITLLDGTVLNGANGGIKFPSAGRTGIKIKLASPFAVVSGSSQMIVDFDLGNSFVMRGNSITRNGLLFKPVIRATASEETGGIAGTVHATSQTGAVVPNASIEVLKSGTALSDTVSANVIATTKSDSLGAYSVMWLQPSSYAVRATPPTGSTNQPALVANVTVTSGKTATGTDIVLP